MRNAVYPELVGKMAVRGITRRQIQSLLGISIDALYNKMCGYRDVKLQEAVQIHQTYFPDTDFLSLFRRER